MYERGRLTDAIMDVLRVYDEPMTSHEVFERLPDIGRVVHGDIIKTTIKMMARRGKVERIVVNEKIGRVWVKNRYKFIQTHGGTNIVKAP